MSINMRDFEVYYRAHNRLEPGHPLHKQVDGRYMDYSIQKQADMWAAAQKASMKILYASFDDLRHELMMSAYSEFDDAENWENNHTSLPVGAGIFTDPVKRGVQQNIIGNCLALAGIIVIWEVE